MEVEEILIGLLEIIEADSPRCQSSILDDAEDYLRSAGYRRDGITGTTWIKET